MDTIRRYFPDLTPEAQVKLETMMRLYPEWNEKINVISRKDIDNLEVNHLLHSLAIAKFIRFVPGTRVLDFGCGGGLPGLPLAAVFPDCTFLLADRTGKKLRVAADIAEQAGIKNVSFFHGDVAEIKEKFDFVVSRAVMPLPDLIKLCRKNVLPGGNNPLPNGVITLKGGDVTGELRQFQKTSLTERLSQWFDEPFFDTKLLTYTQI